MADDTPEYWGHPNDPREGENTARLDVRQVALRGGIACLIVAIIAIISGSRWPGGPTDATSEPFVVHCLLTSFGLAVCGHLRRQSATAALPPEPTPSLLTRIAKMLLTFVPMAIIGVNGYLAFEGFRAGGEKLWACAFVIPAALAFLGFGSGAQIESKASAQEKNHVVVESTEGFWGTFVAHLRQTFFVVAFLTLMIAALFSGTVYATIIRMALINDRFIGWDVFIKIFERLDQWDLLEIAAPLIAIALVYPIFGLVAGIWTHFRRGRRKDFERDLSADEVAAIERYARDVEQYTESINTSGSSWILIAWSFGFLLLIPLTYMFLDGGLGASLLEPMRAPAEGWYIYNDGPGGGEAMAFVTLFAAWCLLLAGAPLISAKMTVLSFEANAQQNLRGDNAAQMLRRQIAVDIRRGKLKPEDNFDPAAYLKQIARKLFKVTANVTLGLAAITMVCFAADRADFELVTKGGIKYRNYLSADLIDADFSDIAEIDLTCRMTGSDDERSILLHYKFIMQNGDEIYLLSATNPREVRFRIPRRLDALIEADALARRVGTPAPAKRYTWRVEVDQLEVQPDECRLELARLLTHDVAAQVMKLFATDLANEPDLFREPYRQP